MTATDKQPEACQRGQYGSNWIRKLTVQRPQYQEGWKKLLAMICNGSKDRT